MRNEEFVQQTLPFARRIACISIELAQLFHATARCQLHTAEQRVAHEHRQPASVAHHRIRRPRRCRVLGAVFALPGHLPFIHQAGIDRVHHEIKP